ncbi:MAG: LytR family transcriptional regulator [Calditrichaeota bacterium]|nr:LytR family transcriptional regulator [Calditrichota bacterium]
MSTNPRPRMRYDADDPDRRLRVRLDLLIGLMIVQVLLSIGLWVDRYRSQGGTPLPPAAQEAFQTPESASPSTPSSPPLSVLDETPVTQVYTSDPVIEEPPVVREPVSEPKREPAAGSKIRIQVLNGCGVPGVAKRARDWLARRNYDVRDVGNADRQDYRMSKVVNRSGIQGAARDLARVLGVDESHVSNQAGPAGLDFDLTFIIGKDYKRLPFAR